VWPLYKAVAGHDPITGEDLEAWERAVGAGMAAVDLVALLIAIPSGGASVAGAVVARTVIRELLVNALATGVSLLTYEIAVALDLPPWLATLAAMGVGLVVSVAGTRAVVRRLDAAGNSVGDPIEVDLARPKTSPTESLPKRPDLPESPSIPKSPDVPGVHPPDGPTPPKPRPEPDLAAPRTPDLPHDAPTAPKPRLDPDTPALKADAAASDAPEAGGRSPDLTPGGTPDAGVPPPMSRVPPRVENTTTWKGKLGSRDSFAAQPGLEANTCYKVPDRGTFYTDADGEVVFAETPSYPGGKLNPDLRDPQPNATYVVTGDHGAHLFVTDQWGRTVYVEADALALADARRSTWVQQQVGHLGPDGLYDGGHLLGNRFGGIPEEINIVPMLSSLNRAGRADNFYALERELRRLLAGEPPPQIRVRIDIEYPDVPGGPLTDSLRVPDRFTVGYRVNNERRIIKEFNNVP
jgi:hypothetical protein